MGFFNPVNGIFIEQREMVKMNLVSVATRWQKSVVDICVSLKIVELNEFPAGVTDATN